MFNRNLRGPTGVLFLLLSSVLLVSGAPQTGELSSGSGDDFSHKKIKTEPDLNDIMDEPAPGHTRYVINNVNSKDTMISTPMHIDPMEVPKSQQDKVPTRMMMSESNPKKRKGGPATEALDSSESSENHDVLKLNDKEKALDDGKGSSSPRRKIFTVKAEDYAQGLALKKGELLPLIISDLKFDDNLFITVVHKEEELADPHVVATSLKNRERGVSTTNDFLEKKLAEQPKVKYIFNDIATKAAPHEVNFMEENEEIKAIPIEKYLEDIKNFPQKKVIVFQIGQMKAQRVEELLKKISSKLIAYGILAMYNARQGSEEATLEFLTSLQSKARAFSGNKDAVFFYSDNWNSFVDGVGSMMEYSKLLGHVPRDHLNMAMKDPFHSRQIFDGAASLIESAVYAGTEMGALAEAIYNLGTLPDFKIRGETEEMAPPKLVEAMAAAREYYKTKHAAWQQGHSDQGASQAAGKKPSLIVELSKVLEGLLQEEEATNHQREVFVAKSTREKGKINKTSEDRASIKANEGEALGYVINSARVSDTEIGRTLNQEMKKFVEAAIVAMKPIKEKNLVTSRLKTGVTKGLKVFAAEATDGLHGTLTLNSFFSGEGLLANLQQIREHRHPLYLPARFKLHQNGFTVAKLWKKEKSQKPGYPKEPHTFMLYKADAMRPQEILLNKLEKSTLPPEAVEFTLKDADPFRCLEIDATSSAEPAKSKAVSGLPDVADVKGSDILESKISQKPEFVEDTVKGSELGVLGKSESMAKLPKFHR